MKERPLVLVTNDDGVQAPGIKELWKSLKDHVEVVVVAPMEQQSAVSLSITTRRPLHIEKIDGYDEQASVWAVNGTPADCVKLALHVILPRKPDLIVSGINRGTNAGRNVLYSGTVAAVIEGVMQDVPGIAFSMWDFFNPHYASANPCIFPIVHYVLTHPLPAGILFNVNFPKQMQDNFNGIRLSTQGKEYWMDEIEERTHPAEKHSYYWLGARLAKFQEEETSDIALLQQGYATVVPIYIGNLTYFPYFQKQQHTFDQFIASLDKVEAEQDIPLSSV